MKSRKKSGGRKKMTSAAVKTSRNEHVPVSTYGLLWLPVVIFFLMLSCLSVFYIWERIRFRQIQKDIVELQKVKKILTDDISRLRVQSEELSSYRRIYKIAREHFGYIELKPTVIINHENSPKSK